MQVKHSYPDVAKAYFLQKTLFATSGIFFDYQGKASIVEDIQIC
jgi:hypothetical protein